LSTGVRTTLAVKIFGPDLQTIQRIGQDIERALAPLPGTASVYAERSFGGRYLDIRPDADALARYGLTTGDAQEVISLALGGEEITTTVEGRERYPVQVRYARDFRDDPTTISRLLVGSSDGPQVPLGQVAEMQFSPGPPMIRSEGGYLYDQVSVAGRAASHAGGAGGRDRARRGQPRAPEAHDGARDHARARAGPMEPRDGGERDEADRGADGGRDGDVHRSHLGCDPGDLLLVAAQAHGDGRRDQQRFGGAMSTFQILAISGALALVGCGKKKEQLRSAMPGMQGMPGMMMRSDSLMPMMRADLDSLARMPSQFAEGMLKAHEGMASQML